MKKRLLNIKLLAYIYFISVLFCNNTLMAQRSNLVINPSFEEYNTCPLWAGGIYQGYCNYWNSPIDGSTDYYNSCDLDVTADVPLNFAGFEYARTGNAYAGFIIYYFPSPSYREYIQGILYDTLKVGQSYIVKYFISLSDIYYFNKFCIDNIGVYLIDTQLYYPTLNTNIPLVPTLQNHAGNWMNAKIGWQRIEGRLTANGGEKFITIGNFQNNTNTNKQDCFGLGISNSDIYIYVDDVSLIDTSLIDTISLCFSDSIQIGDIYASSTGMYYDTVEGLIARTYVQMRPQYASFREVDVPYHRGDTVKIGMREFCYSDTVRTPFIYCDSLVSGSCFRVQYLWPTPDTFIDERYTNIYGCDSTVRYHIRTNVGINDPSASTYHNITIYPNPASQLINLKISIPNIRDENENPAELQVEIYDAVGNIVSGLCHSDEGGISNTGKEINYKINISELSKGIYFIKVIGKENRVIGNARFIKN